MKFFKSLIILFFLSLSLTSFGQNNPKFDWDKVNLGFIFDKLKALATDEEMEFMTSRGGLLIIEKAYGRDIDEFPYTEYAAEAQAQALKAYDPDFKVYLYRNAIINWTRFEAAQEFLQHEDWWLRKLDGSILSWVGVSHDFSNPEVVDWYTETARKAVVDGSCDGIFIDAKSKLYQESTRNKIGQEKYDSLTAGFSQTLQNIQAEFGEDNHIILNGGYIDLDFEGAEEIGDDCNYTLDGVFWERFATGDLPGTSHLARINWLIDQHDRGADFVIVKAWPYSWDFTDEDVYGFAALNVAGKKERAAEEVGYALACFLMAAQENFHFVYNWGWLHSNGAFDWYPEYDIKIGEPFGSYENNENELVLSRHFKHVKVKVDLETRETNFFSDYLWLEPSSSTENVGLNNVFNGEYTKQVNNPNISDEKNTNDKVSRFVSPSGINSYVTYNLSNPVTDLSDYRINLKAYLNNAVTNSNNKIRVQFMNSILGESSIVSVDQELSQRKNWEELNFDFHGNTVSQDVLTNGGYDIITILFAPDISSGQRITYYIDGLEGSSFQEPSDPTLNPEEGALIHITKRNATGYAIDGGSGGSNGQNVTLSSSNILDEGQLWLEIDRGDGFYSYEKYGTNYSLDGNREGANNQSIYLWETNATNQNQQWQKVAMGDGGYKLIKRNATGFAINGGSGGVEGRDINLWSSASTNQNLQWYITPINTTTAENVRLEAEDYDSMSGIQTEASSESGDNVGWINDGDWLRFDDVSLSGITNMDARVSSKFTGGTIEVRTGSATGTLIGSIEVSNTGGDQNWATLNTSIINASGTQDVYLVFTGGNGYLFNVNWVEFNTSSQSNKDIIATAEVSDMILYPNPVISTTTIENAANLMITIYTMDSSIVFSQAISNEREVIDLSEVSTGIYFAEVRGEGILEIIKLVKE